MFIRRNIHIIGKITAAIVLTIGLVLVGASQTTSTEKNTQVADDTPEEIVVYGEKSLIVLRNELFTAQEDFFDVFNSMNSTNDFDIKCDKITYLGSRRKFHRCMPKFAIRHEALGSSSTMMSAYAHQFEAMDFSDDVNSAIGARIRRKDKELWAEFATLVIENPELQEGLVKLRQANQALEIERQRK